MCSDESIVSPPALNIAGIMDQMADAFFALDTEWRITYINSLARELLRHDSSSLIGKCIWREFTGIQGSKFELEYRKSLTTQVPVRFEEYFEPLERWFDVRAYPSEDGLYVYFQDVTSTKLMEQQMLRSGHIVTQAQKIAEIGVWEWDIALDTVYWSEGTCRIGQHPRTTGSFEVFINQMVHVDDRNSVRNAIQEALRGQPYDVEYRLLLPDGEVRMIRCQGEVLFEDTGVPSRMIGIAQDISKQKVTENLLEESRQKYESLKTYNPDGICSLDFAGGLMGVNPALEQLLGYSRDELLRMSFVDLVFSTDVSEVEKFLSTSGPDNHGVKTECRMKCKNGSTIDVYCTRVPIVTNDEMRGLYVVVQDVTESKKAEQRLLEAEARYQLISEHSQDIISYTAPDGVFEYVSPAITKSLGYEAEEVVGQSNRELYHPDDIPYLQTIAEKVFRGEDIDRFECRVRHKNGTYLWFETTMKFIRDENGEIVRILGVGRDITERKQGEIQLQESEERYRALVESSLDAIAVTDGQKWLYMNDAGCKMFGAASRSDMLGRKVHEFLHPDYHTICKERVQTILYERKIPELIEEKWYTCDGKVIETEVLAIPIMFEDNKAAVQVIIRNISERRQAEQLLIQSEKLSAVGQLAAGVAHEIRNPLTALKGFLQLLRSTSKGVKSEYFDVMDHELSRIDMISGEMLMLAKPQAAACKAHNIQSILRSIVTLLETQAVMKDIQIVMECEDVSPVTCAENQIKQVFVNLIKNAIEAMPQGGQISIRMREYEHKVFIEFEDQGPGIPKELLARLGEPFFTTKDSGTGLGVMVTRKIVHNHRGDISFTSQMGVGTTVTVALPVACPDGVAV